MPGSWVPETNITARTKLSKPSCIERQRWGTGRKEGAVWFRGYWPCGEEEGTREAKLVDWLRSFSQWSTMSPSHGQQVSV